MMKFLRIAVLMTLCLVVFEACTSAPKRWMRYRTLAASAEDWFTNRTDLEFCRAIEWGDTNKMGQMLDAGLSVNAAGVVFNNSNTYLCWAMLKQNKDSFGFLLEKGADPNILCQAEEIWGANSPTLAQFSALSLAAMYKKDSYFLINALKYGGNPNADVDDMLIIYRAINSESFTNLQILIQNGADVNGLYPKKSNTPLSHCLIKSRYDIAYFLLEHGADPDLIEREKLVWVLKMPVYSNTGEEDLKKQSEYRRMVIELLKAKGVDLVGIE